MGRIMDPIHYDKIADKLIQFNSKLPLEVNLESTHATFLVEQMKRTIEEMLFKIERMANIDENGWLR
jgi:hypothetical protein